MTAGKARSMWDAQNVHLSKDGTTTKRYLNWKYRDNVPNSPAMCGS